MFPYFYIGNRLFGTYGICMLIGFALSIFLAQRRGKRYGLRFEDLMICVAFIFILALLCGSLTYIFVTYSFAEVIAMIRQGDFSFGGGIVFYGGLIGGILGCWLGLKIAKIKFYTIEQAAVPFIPLGHAIGRIGCVMAGCCHGREYEGPLALYYPNSVAGLSPEQGYFPVQLLEALINVAVICPLLLIVGKRTKKPTILLSVYLILYAICRFITELFRGDEIRGRLLVLSTSQWISVVLLLGAGCNLLVHYLKARPKAE